MSTPVRERIADGWRRLHLRVEFQETEQDGLKQDRLIEGVSSRAPNVELELLLPWNPRSEYLAFQKKRLLIIALMLMGTIDQDGLRRLQSN